MVNAVFELNNVNYSYHDKFIALNDVSMTVLQGEKIAILGANGSGKTTLMHILSGLVFPSSGTITAFGRLLTEQSLDNENFNGFFRQKVGLVFQNPDIQLFSNTVWDEIAFGPLQIDIPEEEIINRVEEVMKFMRLTGLKERTPYNLSNGEKKKVAIASILSVNPDVLLLDEPTAGLDPRSARELINLIVKMNEMGKTIITTTHDIHIVSEIADRVYILGENKQIICSGKTEEVMSKQEVLNAANLIHVHKHRHGESDHIHPHKHPDS